MHECRGAGPGAHPCRVKAALMSYSRSPLSRPAHSASDDSAYRSGAPVALAAVLLLLLGILSPLGSAGGARADESGPAPPRAGRARPGGGVGGGGARIRNFTANAIQTPLRQHTFQDTI